MPVADASVQRLHINPKALSTIQIRLARKSVTLPCRTPRLRPARVKVFLRCRHLAVTVPRLTRSHVTLADLASPSYGTRP